jgi:acyl carrier protein
MTDEIRRIVTEHGRLPVDVDALPADADLFLAGMSSHASVNVMLALEDAFDIEFPDALLNKATFCTLERLEEAITALQPAAAPQGVTA